MNRRNSTGGANSSLVKAVWNAFDIRDFCVFGGIGSLGYGLYLKYGQWVPFVVCGALIMLLGLGLLTRQPPKQGK